MGVGVDCFSSLSLSFLLSAEANLAVNMCRWEHIGPRV